MDRITHSSTSSPFREKGFTLLECIAVVILCGFLATIAIRLHIGAMRETERTLRHVHESAQLISILEAIEANVRIWRQTTQSSDPVAFQNYVTSLVAESVPPEGIHITMAPLQYHTDAADIEPDESLLLVTVWTDALRLSRVLGL